MRHLNIIRNEQGQILIMLAVALPVLILFSGLAIDSGLLYVAKAKLSTSGGCCLPHGHEKPVTRTSDGEHPCHPYI